MINKEIKELFLTKDKILKDKFLAEYFNQIKQPIPLTKQEIIMEILKAFNIAGYFENMTKTTLDDTLSYTQIDDKKFFEIKTKRQKILEYLTEKL